MYFIHYIWCIAIIIKPNAGLLSCPILESFTDAVIAIFPDGSSIKALGRWYVFALSGDDNLHRQIKYYTAEVKLDNSGLIAQHTYEYDNKVVSNNYSLGFNIQFPVEVSFYPINENKSSKFGPGLDYTAMCITRDEQLSSHDEQILNYCCPPKTIVKIRHTNCKYN